MRVAGIMGSWAHARWGGMCAHLLASFCHTGHPTVDVIPESHGGSSSAGGNSSTGGNQESTRPTRTCQRRHRCGGTVGCALPALSGVLLGAGEGACAGRIHHELRPGRGWNTLDAIPARLGDAQSTLAVHRLPVCCDKQRNADAAAAITQSEARVVG